MGLPIYKEKIREKRIQYKNISHEIPLFCVISLNPFASVQSKSGLSGVTSKDFERALRQSCPLGNCVCSKCSALPCLDVWDILKCLGQLLPWLYYVLLLLRPRTTKKEMKSYTFNGKKSEILWNCDLGKKSDSLSTSASYQPSKAVTARSRKVR